MLAKLFLLPSPVRFLPDSVVQTVSEHSSLCPHLYNSKVMSGLFVFFFLFCRKHSTLMTGEVTRRSIQTLKQENRPKFGPLIKAGRPKKKKLWSSTPPLWPKDFLSHSLHMRHENEQPQSDEMRAGWDESNKRRCEVIKWRGRCIFSMFCCAWGFHEELRGCLIWVFSIWDQSSKNREWELNPQIFNNLYIRKYKMFQVYAYYPTPPM